MRHEVEIRVSPSELFQTHAHKRDALRKLHLKEAQVSTFRLVRRSIDARPRPPVFQLKYEVWTDESPPDEFTWKEPQNDVRECPPVIIVGFGPAGMFAALRLIELGYKPVVLERGKDVRARRRDLAALNKEGIVNPESNYCFGEGGAGTFSDGKLYTRSTKRGDVRRILEIFVRHGADPDILIDAHPHIGTNKLPGIVQAIRETILAHGGEVHFDTRVSGFTLRDGKFTGVSTTTGKFDAAAVILATGHSARDIFYSLHQTGIYIEYKPFALGVRVEHPQSLIDSVQYHCDTRHENLPAASYSWVEQVHLHKEADRGVFSFCMCPGGIICPAATNDAELVVNGWSPSKRNSPYANSGIVAEVKEEDLKPFQKYGPLAGMMFQQHLETLAFEEGGGKFVAPAARLTDFLSGKLSGTLPECSYLPGVNPGDLSRVFTRPILHALQNGFVQRGKKMKGYLTEEAIVVAIESRTSSPVRIPRDAATHMHPQVAGLFPCGEGAGYAGGIMSAAIDGEKCADAVAAMMMMQ